MDSYADLLNLNFMYSLRTGNLLTDMMIAALLPLISGAVAYVTRTWWPQLINQVLAYFSNVDSTSVFFRVSEESGSLYYGHTLRVALSTYVTKVLQPRYDVAELKYITVPGKKLHEAENYAEGLRDYCFVDAGPAKEVPMSLTANLELQQSSAGSGGEEGSGDGGDSGKDKKSADTIFTLVQFRPSFPALRRLLGVEDKEKTAMGQEEGESAADPAAAQAVAELVKAEQGNGDAIQLLLDRALAHYRNEYKEASISSDRFLYQPLLAKAPLTFGVAADDEDRREGAMDCNRYLLRSEKTFSSLFFPDKARLLQLIDNFENKTGKYAIPGYPQKLVLLLYGPPGTGKTSLAKAVAAYTKRDLFAISLSRIRSNEELLKYMFSGQVCIKNNKKKEESHSWRDRDSDDAPSQLDPTRLVYILEDVDATNAVVLKNEAEAEAEEEAGKKSNDKKKKKKVLSKKAAKVVSNADEEGEEAESEQQPHDDDKTDVDACENAEKAETENAASEAAEAEAEAESQGTDCEVVAVGGNSGKAKRKLTIEGLTNALNGVLDFPQRIVIMTTNHIERLHPSLLRPGVVTMKLHMHNFDAECAADMVRHYFSHTDIHPAQLQELRGLVEKASTRASKVDAAGHNSDDGSSSAAAECKGFSPAELEQRCAECETVDELLAALRQGSRVNTF